MAEGGVGLAAYTAEFVGTFMLVFTVGCNVLAGNPAWASTSIACVLMVCIYAYGPISGGHFNPAVSLAEGIAHSDLDSKHLARVPRYMFVQLVAGVSAGFAYSLMLGGSFALGPAQGFGWWQALLVEFIYTFVLCFVVLNVASEQKGNEFYGLAIGFVLVAGVESAGHISGGCFNPAVAAGIALAAGGKDGIYWWVMYSAAELVAACVAALIFKLLQDSKGAPKPLEASSSDVIEPRQNGNDTNMFETSLVESSLVKKLIAEFIGTYVLVLTVGLNVLGRSNAAVFSIAASLMCMIYALGHISGAHFNPAVTLAVKVSAVTEPPLSMWHMVTYFGAQLVGGICGALTYTLLEGGKTFLLQPGEKYGWLSAVAAEFVFTFLLASIVLTVACSHEKSDNMYGLAIGSCVTVGGCAIGAVSGGSLNPAVSASVSLTRAMFEGNVVDATFGCAMYLCAELLAGVAAAGVFFITHAKDCEA